MDFLRNIHINAQVLAPNKIGDIKLLASKGDKKNKTEPNPKQIGIKNMTLLIATGVKQSVLQKFENRRTLSPIPSS
jgi:hypothetical protein